MLFDGSRAVNLTLDENLNVVGNDSISGNITDYMISSMKMDFKSRFEAFDGIVSMFMAFTIGKEEYPTQIYVYKDEDLKHYQMVITDITMFNNTKRQDYIGYIEYDFKNRFILSFHKNGQDLKLMESMLYLTEENSENITVYAEHVTSYIQFMRNVIEDKNRFFQMYVDGKLRWIELELVGVNFDINHICYLSMVDVTKKIDEQMTIIKKSFRDELTNTLQKESILQYIRDYLDIYKENTAMLAMIDIDYFKQINDTYGHSFGDLVLSKVCNAFRKNISKYPGSQIGRFGGDEFLIFVPNVSSYTETKELCSRIRSEVGKIYFPELKSFTLSCTNGITRYPLDGDNLDVLLKKSDKALYRGKMKGRDCYIIYDETKCGGINDDAVLNLADISKRLEIGHDKPEVISRVTANLVLNPNLEEAIPMALDEFRREYGVERIVFKYMCDGKEVSFVSCEDENKITKDYTLSTIEKFKDYFANNELNLSNTSTMKFRNVLFQQTMLKLKISATSMYRIPDDNGSVKALISFEMCTVKRTWQPFERGAFKVLRESLLFYLNKYNGFN